jgi:hypothetical protein
VIRPNRFIQFAAPIATAALLTIAAQAQTTHPSPADSEPRQRTPPPAKSTVITIDGTLEAALGQPQVQVQVMDGSRILTAEPELTALEDARSSSFTAFLDTGAGGLVLSKATARRFGIVRRDGAEFHEVGLHGETTVDVSAPLQLYLSQQTIDYGPIDGHRKLKFLSVQKDAVFQISRDEPSALLAMMGDMNVIGMPAIRKLVVEIDPSPMRGNQSLLGVSPAVRLLDAKSTPKKFDIEIPLENIDYNQRKHPGNRGPLPTLAAKPTITGVTTTNKSETFNGDWLLDTGAAASIISVKHAQKLGLFKDDGTPAIEPPFTLPLGGIGGEVKPTPGFVIDQVTIKAKAGKTLVFRKVHVVVKDVAATLDSGRHVVLDGILGMNLLLPSSAGLGSLDINKGLDPDQLDSSIKLFPGGFDRIWIDGPRNVLALRLKSK